MTKKPELRLVVGQAVTEDGRMEDVTVPTFDIREHIQIAMIIAGPTKGWIRTHGMEELGLPELEMKEIPLFLLREAGGILNHIAQCIYEQKDTERPIQLNQNLQFTQEGIHPAGVVRFLPATPIPGEEMHYMGKEVWEVVSDEKYYGCRCERCSGKNASQDS